VRRPRLPKTASVRVRAAGAAALAAALCFAGGALWLRHVIYANGTAASIETAQAQARGIAATYNTPEARLSAEQGALAGKDVQQRVSGEDIALQFPFYTESYAVVDNHGKLLLAGERLAYYVRESGLRFPTTPPPMTEGWTGHIRVFLRPSLNGERGHKLDGREVTLVARNIGDDGRERGTVYVLATPLPAENAVHAVDRWLIAGLPVAVLLVAAVAWWAAGSALRPVERMRAELARITAADMTSRVPPPETGDEIARLAETMNATLDRLADAAERQRRFVADAAHELRSPLAGLRNTVEVALAHGDSADPQVLRATIERLHRLTDDLLLLARLERTAPAAGKPVDLTAIADELAGERRYRVPPEERIVVDAAEPALVTGREEELARLLGNLLDNACRYARDRITVTVAKPKPGWVRVVVRDDGPGIPEADRERVFERFARVDEARDRGHGGAGLGLAIARDIAERHGGRLYAARSAGGACLVAELPQTPRT